MTANSSIAVSDLNFDTIKTSLKAFLSSQSEFTDYNFEGSVISTLIDLLAYNTYLNNYFVSMVGNEMYLDSALLRKNIVSRAKALGYTPRSARGASISATAVITPNDSPDSITVLKNTQFTSTSNGTVYTFVTPENYVINANNGIYSGTITIKEGLPLTHRFNVSSTNPTKYIIPNDNVDTTSLEVKVQNSSVDSSTTTFNLANDITAVTATSPVYFLQEVDGRYEIYFGDGVIGKPVQNGNIVIVSYRVCNGPAGNDLSVFTNPTTLGGYSTFTVTFSGKTSGGSNNESEESIRFNAPKNFELQNRAVTSADYERLVLREFGNIQTLRVWGGEENKVPVYGKVFISAKPTTSNVLADQQKDEIKALLKKYNVMSVDVEFIDPSYIYLLPTITVNYNSSLTTLSTNAIRSKIVAAIQNFERNNLGTFNNDRFRISKFMKTIDDTDSSIMSNRVLLRLQKRFTPNFNASTKYTIGFETPLENITKGFVSLRGIPTNHPGGGVALTSSAFVIQGLTCYLDDDGFGNVRTYYLTSENSKAFITRSQGTIDYSTGLIVLNSFAPTSAPGNEIRINVVPAVNDIQVSRYQLMLFGQTLVSMFDENTRINTPALTVSTTGSVTQINETAIGTLI